ncbi:AEC family transporter [Clostridium sp. chh4-2]|uniref:AEC family transporter n=1 Tax=Clostridium sp. chh4-2 TaxID=2067550 RepID=UPI000CCF536C|nr:AEC family transporter [Clostridium sp. chh4-2]PNV59929.1 AEC family transporter [Clostridium sp. chh4-2]
MELAAITAYKIITMFVMAMIGAVCFKTNIITSETNGKLSNLLLMVIAPLMIFCSYQREFSRQQLEGLFMALFLAAVSHVIAILITKVFIRKSSGENYGIESMAAIYSNCGFMGIPLVNGIFGADGVFYITAYITVFNLFVWTHGILLMIGKQTAKEALKAMKTPTIFAIAAGLIFYLFQIRLPEMIREPLAALGDMNTPVAMLVAGASLADSSLIKMLKKKRIYLISSLRLLVIPLITMVVLNAFHLDPMVTTTVVLATACPAGSTGTLFALRYGKDAIYASELFGVTTTLSLITIPLVMLVYTFL